MTTLVHAPTIAAAASLAIAREWKGLRVAVWIVMWALLILAMGGVVESTIAPVLVRHNPSNVRRVDEDRLCWNFEFTKARFAMPSRVYAELFLDEAYYPVFVGIEHDDGTAVGGILGWEPGSAKTVQCVHIPKNGYQAKRLGVRIHIAYTTAITPWRIRMPWFVPGPDTWVDYYAPNYTGPRGS